MSSPPAPSGGDGRLPPLPLTAVVEATNTRTASPWRDPSEETTDLYPNLVVCDNRVSGSITISRSRLPVWAITSTAIGDGGWDCVQDGWSVEEYGFTLDDFMALVYNVFELRGDFGRLLLAMANGERCESDMRDEFYDEHGVAVGDGITDITHAGTPPSWWNTPELAEPVIDLMERCLAILRANTDSVVPQGPA